MKNHQRLCIIAATLLLATACSDEPQSNDKPMPDQGADMSESDMRADMRADLGALDMDMGDESDMRADMAVTPPELTNLPATEQGQVGKADSYQLAVAGGGASVSIAVDANACDLDVAVDTAGLITWTCPATPTSCMASVTVTGEDGQQDQDTLSIACVNGLPAFTTDAPTEATEGVELRYMAACADPDGSPVTLSVAPEDTCGGALEGAAYVWTPDETQGGASCVLRLLCSDGEATEAQQVSVAVAEVNDAPTLDNLPATTSTLWGRMSSFNAMASDGDLPSQPLTYSITNTTCGFPVMISPAGQVSYTCGSVIGTCAATVQVSDGDLTGQAALTIQCTNNTPSVSGVAISPDPIPSLNETLTCQYTFLDADGDADASTIEWRIGGAIVGSGPTLTSYGSGDEITCHVTPSDSVASGTVVMSAPVFAPNATPTALALGDEHSCAIIGGGLKCWGEGNDGQLGDSGGVDRAAPAQVTGLTSGVTMVAAKQYTTCAVHNGAAKCWGDGFFGRLGNGLTAQSNSPAQVTGLTSGVTAVATGDNHSCAVHNGAAKCWGRNNYGQLGDGTTTDSLTPVTVAGLTSGVTMIVAGDDHTCAVHNGALKCWGNNDSGVAGNNNGSQTSSPTTVTGLSSGVTAVATGDNHACAVHNGALKCWGSNLYGKLGDGRLNVSDGGDPVQVSGLSSGVSAVAGGRAHTCAVHNGAPKCWGANNKGQLGDGTSTHTTTPRAVSLPGGNSTIIAAGLNHSCVIQQDTILCWGDNEQGQLGTGQVSDKAPAPVSGLGASSSAIAAGGSTSCALQGGALKCWGDNYYDQAIGQIAQFSPQLNVRPPTNVNTLNSGVSHMSVGASHSCAIQSGAALCWGSTISGRLGGSASLSSQVRQVSGLGSGVTAISAGSAHTCAIHNGALKCWGDNARGQLGDGTTSNANTPSSVSGLSANTTVVAAGGLHTCAVHNGAAKCWGRNNYGQLGDGTTTDSLTPVTVSGLSSGVTALALGVDHTCAVHNGALKCWGRNNYRQLGDGTTSNSSTPTDVSGLSSGVEALATGDSHSCAVQSGAVFCWGRNNERQAGAAGSTISTPTAVSGLSSGVTAISAGSAHSCALQSGAVICWGSDASGQSGAPHSVSLTPTQLAP